MRVGIITELMDERPAGMGSYVRSLVEKLVEVDAGTDYVLLHAQEGGHPAYDRAEEVVVGRTGPAARARRKFVNYPRAIRESRLDVVHYPDYFGPFLTRPPCPAVETIHDLVPFVMPEAHQWDVNFTFRQIFPRFIAPKVDRFIAVSRSTASDMLRFLGIGGGRVTVIPEAAADIFSPVKGRALRETLERYGLVEGYILTVGTLEPRKNVSRLLEAYAAVRERGVRVPLVLTGKKGWKYEGIFGTMDRLGLGEHVVLPDYVDFGDLPALYSGAGVMAYPSLYEGFGLPPLEAMACGCPVITSDASSLPEVVGRAGLTVDPRDPGAIADALESVLTDGGRAGKLSAAGLERAARFSWRKTARATAALYRSVADGRRR